MKKILLFLLSLILLRSAYGGEIRYLVVIEPVADIRAKPVAGSGEYIHDRLQETQVLYNEALLYKDENADWYYAEAIEQKEYSHNNLWQGYPGWIRKKSVKVIERTPEYNAVVKHKTAEVLSGPDESGGILFKVSIGTRFKVIEEKRKFCKIDLADGGSGWIKKADLSLTPKSPIPATRIRKNLITAAKDFLGTPYFWGGRNATGVDCSGLFNLVYRVNNIDVPRDAHEQWMVAQKLKYQDLKPGDLIFVSKKDDFESIVHVMLYTRGDRFIEAPGTGKKVRFNTFKRKFGLDSSELAKKDFIAANSKIYFGRIKDLDE